ncbi:hypothetical protein BaRGS_00019780 [Batillaria attramentaria]|uniref:Uncharacterized protein n=1 Tax=Batillaria attramentaria TaxID=370345 RepID=A0ABD0KPV0_9CAEN
MSLAKRDITTLREQDTSSSLPNVAHHHHHPCKTWHIATPVERGTSSSLLNLAHYQPCRTWHIIIVALLDTSSTFSNGFDTQHPPCQTP